MIEVCLFLHRLVNEESIQSTPNLSCVGEQLPLQPDYYIDVKRDMKIFIIILLDSDVI